MKGKGAGGGGGQETRATGGQGDATQMPVRRPESILHKISSLKG
jgi:hypothetical protein